MARSSVGEILFSLPAPSVFAVADVAQIRATDATGKSLLAGKHKCRIPLALCPSEVAEPEQKLRGISPNMRRTPVEFAKLIPSILESFKTNGRKPLVVAGLVAAGLILGFEMKIISGQTGSFVEANWHWLFILLMSVGALLVYELVAWLGGRYKSDDGLPRQQGKRLDDVLKTLTKHQFSMLGEFIRRDERTLKFCANDSAIRTLLNKNLITMHAWDQMALGGYHDVDCTIQDFVWDRLQILRKEYLQRTARQSEN